MGCFNKSCGITGLQITYNDPIVGIKLKKTKRGRYTPGNVDFDHIGSEWYPIEYPVRGVYDDYGRIEVDGKLYEGDEDVDYDSTRCDDYMFIHEWAYDYIRDFARKKRVEYAKRMKEYGYKDWDAEEKKELAESVADMDEKIASFNELEQTEENVRSRKTMEYMREECIKSHIGRYTQMYYPHENERHWIERLYSDDIKKVFKNIEEYRCRLNFLESWRFELGFQWHPSYVANQTVEEDMVLGLLEKSKEYLLERKREYGE